MRVMLLEHPSPEIVRDLWARLDQHNQRQMNDAKDERVVVVAAEGDKVFGGLIGYAYWGWFSIDVLWVEAPMRNQGIGSALLKEAERVAVTKGCHSAHTDTFEFQAPRFYEKEGYKPFGLS